MRGGRRAGAAGLRFACQDAAIEFVDHASDVGVSFAVWRNAVVLVDRFGAGVVCSQRQTKGCRGSGSEVHRDRRSRRARSVRAESCRSRPVRQRFRASVASVPCAPARLTARALPSLSALTTLASRSTSRLCSVPARASISCRSAGVSFACIFAAAASGAGAAGAGGSGITSNVAISARSKFNVVVFASAQVKTHAAIDLRVMVAAQRRSRCGA